MADKTTEVMPVGDDGSKASEPDITGAFKSFLVGLATDPAKLGAFIKDAGSSMSEAGLDEADQAVLRSGNPGAIHARIAGVSPTAPSPVPVILVVDLTAAKGAEEPGVAIRQGFSLSDGGLPQLLVQSVLGPQIVVHPQIFPQQIFPQVVHPQITHPQIVVHPQIFPQQIFPQQIFPQQIFPQQFQS